MRDCPRAPSTRAPIPVCSSSSGSAISECRPPGRSGALADQRVGAALEQRADGAIRPGARAARQRAQRLVGCGIHPRAAHDLQLARAGPLHDGHAGRVTAHRHRQATALAEQLAAIADAQHRPVDATQHAQHPRQMRDLDFLAPPLGAHLGLLERAAHRRTEPREIVLEHVVHGALMQRLDGTLLADRAGHEDEGHVGRELARNRQRGESIESRQAQIRQDQMRAEPLERLTHREFALHAADLAADAGARQFAETQLSLGRGILDHQDAHRTRRHHSPPAARS